MLQRLARFSYRRRRWVLGGWIVLLIATFALSSSLNGAFKTEFRLPGTESQQAFDLLEKSSFRNRQEAGLLQEVERLLALGAGEKSSFRNRQVQAQIVFAANQGVDEAAVKE